MNPGSKEAIEAGCKCPQMDNGYGRGWGTDEKGNAIFVISGGCPIHGGK